MELKEVLEGIKKHIGDTTTEIKNLLAKQDEEIKKFGKSTEETGAAIDKATKRIMELEEELKAAQTRIDEIEKKGGRLFGGGAEEQKSIGQRFIESEAYKAFNPETDQKSNAMALKSIYGERKTITGAPLDMVPGYLYDPQRVQGIIAGPERAQRVRDLIPVLPTSSGAIEFVRETGFANNAATVPEFEDTDQGPTYQKPKSHLEFENVSTSVKTIAHWLPVTRQILADAAGLQAYIDTRLIYGLKLAEDRQILYGTGAGNDLQGIMTDPNVQTYQWSQGPAR